MRLMVSEPTGGAVDRECEREDLVAIEIAAALKRNILVIPVLADGANMPTVSELPEALRPLARRNAIELRNTQFGRDADRLIEELKKVAGPRNTNNRRSRVAILCVIAATMLVCGGVFYNAYDRDGRGSVGLKLWALDVCTSIPTAYCVRRGGDWKRGMVEIL